jgi:hypothetical protein
MTPRKLTHLSIPKPERRPEYQRVLMPSYRLPADLAEQLNALTANHGEYTRFIEQAIRAKLGKPNE